MKSTLFIFLFLIISSNVFAQKTLFCEPQSPCKYASKSDLGQCLKDEFRLRIFGRSLQGLINSPLKSETRKVYSASVKKDEDTMDILSFDGHISIESFYMRDGRYDGVLDLQGYIFNIICEEI